MGVFAERNTGYKVGLLLLLASIVCYIVGFASSYWSIYQATFEGGGDGMNLSYPFFMEEVRGHNGLWETCDTTFGYTSKTCAAVSHHHGHPAWISAVQGLQCVGLIGLIVACGYAGIVNFTKHYSAVNSRYLELLVTLSGLLGFIGSTIYAAESHGAEDIILLPEDKSDPFFFYGDEYEGDFVIDQNDLAWGYCLNLTGCLLAQISAVILCAYNRRITPNVPWPATGVSFSAAGASVDGRLEFLPPGHLAGGFHPPPAAESDRGHPDYNMGSPQAVTSSVASV